VSSPDLPPMAPPRSVALQGEALTAARRTGRSLDHCYSQFVPLLYRHFDPSRISFKAQAQLPSAPLHGKGQFGPTGKQMGIDGNAGLLQLEASSTEHRRLPETTKCAHVYTAGGIAHVVCQIDLCSLAEIGSRKRRIPEPRGDEGMQGRAQ